MLVDQQEIVRKELKYATESVYAPSTCHDRKRKQSMYIVDRVDKHCSFGITCLVFYIRIFLSVYVSEWGLVARDTALKFLPSS